MNVVGYGGGTDSTAMLIGLWRHHVPVDLILFADPGAEQPHTYAYLDTMSRWLENHGMPAITRVWYTEKNGQRLTLEQECLRSGTLPSIAYGYKKCSLKHKVAPQEKFCRHYQPCIDAWEKGEKVVKFIGYDAGEERRLLNALPHDLQDKKYQKEYPLMEWGWSRKGCIQAIRDAGLPLPGKSSCFFCPSMKRWEIRTLYHRYPVCCGGLWRLKTQPCQTSHQCGGWAGTGPDGILSARMKISWRFRALSQMRICPVPAV